MSIRDRPDIFPINYVVDRGGVVFRTAEGTKLAASVLGRGVAFEVDGLDPDAGEAWSVIVKGHAVEIERMDDVLDALDLPLFPWHASPKHRFVRIQPVEVTRPQLPRRRAGCVVGSRPGRAMTPAPPTARRSCSSSTGRRASPC